MPHEASKIPRGSDQKQMIVIGHQTLGKDFDTQGYGSCAALEKGLVTGGGPGGRLASQPTVYHMIDRTPDIQAASVEPLAPANKTLNNRLDPLPQVSALQLQRQLEIGSYRSAWFLCHRIRYALKDHMPTDLLNGSVEADETYLGGKSRGRGRGYTGNKTPVVSLVERGGRVRSQVCDVVTGKAITKVLKRHVAATANLNTDESPIYAAVGKTFASHATVNHRREEYARRDISGRLATTNTAEGLFGNSKRSLDGTHHHISRKHTDLYFAELDCKYNTRKETDGARTIEGIQGIEGKRLMLRKPKIRG